MQWGQTPNGHRAAYSEHLPNYTPRCAWHARALDRQQAANRRDGLLVSPRARGPRPQPQAHVRPDLATPPALFDDLS